MWWMPASVAKAGLCGPINTLLALAHLRYSRGKGISSPACTSKHKQPSKSPIAMMIFFIDFLFGKFIDAERNRQTNQDHVDQQTLNQTPVCIGPFEMKRAERQNDQVHHQKKCDPEKHSTGNPMFDDERKLSADQVIDRCPRDADKIMQA